MIRGPGDGQEYTVTELTCTVTDEEPTVAYLQDVPMGIAVEWIAAVLIVLFVIASTLLGCLVYSFIWVSLKSRALVRHKSPVTTQAPAVSFGSVATHGQQGTRRFRFSDSHLPSMSSGPANTKNA